MLSRQLLSLGASEPWPEILLEFTGSDKVDASAILEYFQPLDEWLDQVRTKNKFDIKGGNPLFRMKQEHTLLNDLLREQTII